MTGDEAAGPLPGDLAGAPVAVGDTDTCSEAGQPITSALSSSGLITYACIGLDRTCTSVAIPGVPAIENFQEALNAIFGRANLDQLDLSAFTRAGTLDRVRW